MMISEEEYNAMLHKEYLGDSVYIGWIPEDSTMILITNNGDGINQCIFFERETLTNLKAWLEKTLMTDSTHLDAGVLPTSEPFGPWPRPHPMDPDPNRFGIFRNHNCSYCRSGQLPCKQGNPNSCGNPMAQND